MTDPGRRPEGSDAGSDRGPKPGPAEGTNGSRRADFDDGSGARGHESGARGRDSAAESIRFWYRSHADRVYRYARWRTGSRRTAEAVVSDVFLEAWRSADGYDPERGSVESWLLGIARNVILRHRTREEHAPELTGPGDLDDLASPEPSPEDRAVREERRQRLLEAVWELPPDDRDLIALAYGADLSRARIARILDLSPGAVRTRLHRILERLRGRLRDGP